MNIRRVVAFPLATVVTAVTAPAVVATAAPAWELPYRVTARTADTVTQGQVFTIRGRYVYLGKLVKDGHVKVQTRRDGRWTDLPGASVTTNDEGRYRVRVSLSQTGTRKLAVLAWRDGKQGVAVKNITVEVTPAA